MRVLLADDHAIVRRGLRSLLETEPGVDVVAEAGGGGVQGAEVRAGVVAVVGVHVLALDRVAQAQFQLPGRGQVAHPVGVGGGAAGADRTGGAVEPGRVEVPRGTAAVAALGGVQQVQAGDQARALAGVVQLELLRALLLGEIAAEDPLRLGQAVHVQQRP